MARGLTFTTVGLTVLIVLVLVHPTCCAPTAKVNHTYSASSCGSIHNISFPFRLKTDPENCGDFRYELSCENNRTVLYISRGKYYVQEISYNYTIRIVDSGLHKDNYFSFSTPTYSSYRYLKVGITNASQVEESCKVEKMFRTSWPRSDDSNISCKDVHNELGYGFELSWLERNCESYCARDSHYCYLNDSNLFLHLAAKIVLRTPCVVAVLICKWRKRHLPMYDNVEEFLQSQINLMPIRYSYSEIRKMSKGFEDKLGEGRYGSVHKRKLQSGLLVAITYKDVYDQFSERNDIEMEDATEEEKKIDMNMIIVALWCTRIEPSDCPSMKKVVGDA
ncbi:leaf rust 10 disease-resistance locus receptor-like protein kinase-like 2.4 [Quercus suber]|uniref:Leaf rust 10 disease-resistance locus receptor-like protein kinase-like 2.4 n=1 Tax=Quercus suber TaxID=58331 RepID=A0AAW0JKI3_QUESU